MGEFIEKRRELSIHEYEFMKHLKLFTEEEIRDIKNKRFQHEHKVERRTKELIDFINYIVYENNLLELLAERRSKLRIRDGKHSLEKSIENRIRVLYRRAMDRFPTEYRLWVHYLKHCEKHGFTSEGSRTLDKMLNFHGDRPNAWICAANWEYTQANDVERARHFMFRGLQRHPKCRELYLNFLALHFKEMEKIVENSAENDEKLDDNNPMLCKTLEYIQLIYKHYEKKNNDLDFYVDLIHSLKDLKLLKSFADQVTEDMKTAFTTKEKMWHTLALLALDGSQVLENSEDRDCTEDMEAPTFKSAEDDGSFRERLERCVQVYDDGLKVLPTKQMWTYYIETMLKINEDMSSQQKLRRKVLGAAFKKAYESNSLEEDKFVQYLKLLIHGDITQKPFITEVFHKATEAYPSSCAFWELYLNYLVRNDATTDEIEFFFARSLQQCTTNPLPLWKARFQCYNTRLELSDKLEQMLKEAIVQTAPISNHFQPRYLEFVTDSQDINSARKAYQELQKACAPCLDLHKKMAELESIQPQPDISHWRICHENATQYFGTTSVEVWIDYIKFELSNGSPKNMQSLYERAKARLDADLVGEFVTGYELLRVN
ncbi:U3 small nucleolar RNA-associated protein 6 homolog [Toxorhynchites rutilus septentrionalis]|uniref:U3 small nucleolar RNA-associated protein 6 homolog n=1 Tax=Toxorhynchites rutilus septentrionalis TaxID=329112 RepID=UPI00247840D7|nr:U3 small nucleolar RNA-associated protein 6 homolog [Toxorhynchites rutilus septentrionalis]